MQYPSGQQSVVSRPRLEEVNSGRNTLTGSLKNENVILEVNETSHDQPTEKEEKSFEESMRSPVFGNTLSNSLIQTLSAQKSAQKELLEETKLEESMLSAINFEALVLQQQLLSNIKDLVELRPSVIQNYIKEEMKEKEINALEGLTGDERVKIQQQCQEWWDLT